MDKITLKDQVGGTKNRVTLIKVDGAENTYDVYADRTGVTQVGDEITAAALMQIQIMRSRRSETPPATTG